LKFSFLPTAPHSIPFSTFSRPSPASWTPLRSPRTYVASRQRQWRSSGPWKKGRGRRRRGKGAGLHLRLLLAMATAARAAGLPAIAARVVDLLLATAAATRAAVQAVLHLQALILHLLQDLPLAAATADLRLGRQTAGAAAGGGAGRAGAAAGAAGAAVEGAAGVARSGSFIGTRRSTTRPARPRDDRHGPARPVASAAAAMATAAAAVTPSSSFFS
jgi:hypothetical protein